MTPRVPRRAGAVRRRALPHVALAATLIGLGTPGCSRAIRPDLYANAKTDQRAEAGDGTRGETAPTPGDVDAARIAGATGDADGTTADAGRADRGDGAGRATETSSAGADAVVSAGAAAAATGAIEPDAGTGTGADANADTDAMIASGIDATADPTRMRPEEPPIDRPAAGARRDTGTDPVTAAPIAPLDASNAAGAATVRVANRIERELRDAALTGQAFAAVTRSFLERPSDRSHRRTLMAWTATRERLARVGWARPLAAGESAARWDRILPPRPAIDRLDETPRTPGRGLVFDPTPLDADRLAALLDADASLGGVDAIGALLLGSVAWDERMQGTTPSADDDRDMDRRTFRAFVPGPRAHDQRRILLETLLDRLMADLGGLAEGWDLVRGADRATLMALEVTTGRERIASVVADRLDALVLVLDPSADARDVARATTPQPDVRPLVAPALRGALAAIGDPETEASLATPAATAGAAELLDALGPLARRPGGLRTDIEAAELVRALADLLRTD